MNKELFVITCIRGDETTELGKYLLKAGMEAPLDFFKNVLKKSEPINVNISTTADAVQLSQNLSSRGIGLSTYFTRSFVWS